MKLNVMLAICRLYGFVIISSSDTIMSHLSIVGTSCGQSRYVKSTLLRNYSTTFVHSYQHRERCALESADQHRSYVFVVLCRTFVVAYQGLILAVPLTICLRLVCHDMHHRHAATTGVFGVMDRMLAGEFVFDARKG